MAVNRFNQPIAVDPQMQFYVPNWQEIDKTLAAYQSEYDQVEMSSMQTPEHLQGDQQAVQNYIAKNKADFQKVGQIFASGDTQAGRKSLYELRNRVVQDWLPGGSAYAVRENYTKASEALKTINQAELAGKYTPERANYERQKINKFNTNYNNGAFNTFQYEPAPMVVQDKIPRGLNVADEIVANWINEGYTYANGQWFNPTTKEYRSKERIREVVRDYYFKTPEIIADWNQEAIERGVDPKTYLNQKLNEAVETVVTAKHYEKKTGGEMTESPNSKSKGSGDDDVPPNPFLTNLGRTTNYGVTPYSTLSAPTDSALLQASKELEQRVSVLQQDIYSEINKKTDSKLMDITYVNGLPQLVFDEAYRKSNPVEVANLEAEYSPKLAELQKAAMTRKTYNDFRTKFIQDNNINPTALSEGDKAFDLYLQSEASIAASFGQIGYVDNSNREAKLVEQYKNDPEKLQKANEARMQAIIKADPANKERYEEYYRQLEALTNTMVVTTTAYVLTSPVGDASVNRGEKAFIQSAFQAIGVGNMVNSRTNQMFSEKDKELIKNATANITEDKETGEYTYNGKTAIIAVRNDVELGRPVMVLTIPGLKLSGSKGQYGSTDVEVEVDLGEKSNLKSILVNRGLVNADELDRTNHIENLLRANGGMSATLKTDQYDINISPVYTNISDKESIVEYEVDIFGSKVKYPSTQAIAKLEFDLQQVESRVLNGDVSDLQEALQLFPQFGKNASYMAVLGEMEEADAKLKLATDILLSNGMNVGQAQNIVGKIKENNPYEIPSGVTYKYNGNEVSRNELLGLIATNPNGEIKIEGGEDKGVTEFANNFKNTDIWDGFEKLQVEKTTSGILRLDRGFIGKLTDLNNLLSKPLTVTDVGRTPEANYRLTKQTGSTASSTSRHMYGKAIDIRDTADAVQQLAKILNVSTLEVGQTYEYNGLKILRHKNTGSSGTHIHIEYNG